MHAGRARKQLRACTYWQQTFALQRGLRNQQISCSSWTAKLLPGMQHTTTDTSRLQRFFYLEYSEKISSILVVLEFCSSLQLVFVARECLILRVKTSSN